MAWDWEVEDVLGEVLWGITKRRVKRLLLRCPVFYSTVAIGHPLYWTREVGIFRGESLLPQPGSVCRKWEDWTTVQPGFTVAVVGYLLKAVRFLTSLRKKQWDDHKTTMVWSLSMSLTHMVLPFWTALKALDVRGCLSWTRVVNRNDPCKTPVKHPTKPSFPFLDFCEVMIRDILMYMDRNFVTQYKKALVMRVFGKSAESS